MWTLLGLSLILMVIGQLVHQVYKLRREVKDKNSSTFSVGDYWAANKLGIFLNFILVILVAGANSFLPTGIAIEAVAGLLGLGYAIDSAVSNMFGDKLKSGK